MDQQLGRIFRALIRASNSRPTVCSRRRSARWLAAMILVLFPCAAISLAQLPADRSTTTYLEELEQRQLFGSIIRHCELRFSEPNVSLGLKSQLAARWIRSLTLQTLNLEPQAAAKVWPEVRSTAARLVAETQFFPQHALVRFQSCLIGLGEARLASLYPAFSADRADLREKGIEAARQAHHELRVLHQEILQRAPGIPERSPENDPYPELTREQWYSLARDVEFQMLAALSVRSRFYTDSETASRIDTAQNVIELAATLQPKVSNESILWWETQHLTLEALRGLKDWKNWDIKWQNSPLALAPEQVLGKMTSARVEALLDQENYAEALTQANDFFVLLQKRDAESLREVKNTADLTRVTAWPEFDVARARLYLTLAMEADRLASDKSSERIQSARLGAESQILEFSRFVAKQHGSFWSSEMNRRLLSGAGANAAQNSTTVSVLLLSQTIAEGNWVQVRDLVQAGVQQSVQSGNADLAFEIAQSVAGIPRLIPPQPWMVEQIEAVALGFKQHPKAAATHHFANIIASKLAESQPTYKTTALEVWERHVLQWPATESANRIRLQLASTHVTQEQYELAATALLEIPLDSASYPAATRQWVGVVSGLIYNSRLDAKNREQTAEKWVKAIRPRLQEDGQWRRQWTLDSKRMALLLIQLQLETADPQATWTGAMLRLIEGQSPEPDANLRSRLATVAALVEYHQVSGGTQALENMTQTGGLIAAPDLVWLAQALELRLPKLGLAGEIELAGSTANRNGMVRRAATLQLAVVDSLRTHHANLFNNYQDWLVQQRITALLYSDRIADAIEESRSAAASHEKSLPHQQWLGYCLTRSNHPTDTTAAKNQWRKITSITQKNSDAWFEAKYFLAESQRRLGMKTEAAQLLQYLKATEAHAWQNSPYREPLERLLKSIAANP
ncbi:MAG: hypothetical protein Q8M16_21610 [Pirellulaceae bacterium]|nr:hypothetical protein [Pirellulaceae bacterium]